MSMMEKAVSAINAKVQGGFDGSVKFVIEGEGAILLDSQGARVSDDAAEVTLTADQDTFEAILDGDLDPTSAFMSGKLSVDGDMGQAMKLAGALS
ncbi:SCP2 sterol-binding domain-containing protein [Rhodosalinus sediminis]|jgi:putative sterol carrier protein|uniref:SCP2 sterol-binding domain-containing protein n=1 Tax=Rhodosalinus sediminis TaxID=1940533 RepID=UPI0023577802|nr:SCP2 sterol-binding domain-containing protein [Rhodosalinus sediminis]